jgi:hypothetical protein
MEFAINETHVIGHVLNCVARPLAGDELVCCIFYGARSYILDIRDFA